jgi:hypothetical protein
MVILSPLKWIFLGGKGAFVRKRKLWYGNNIKWNEEWGIMVLEFQEELWLCWWMPWWAICGKWCELMMESALADGGQLEIAWGIIKSRKYMGISSLFELRLETFLPFFHYIDNFCPYLKISTRRKQPTEEGDKPMEKPQICSKKWLNKFYEFKL